MRIPLDYYRILGLPIQASTEQLEQAYRDRILQLPRREYSELAIAARKQLIDLSYAVLSDPEQRNAYDASFLTKTLASETPPRTESAIAQSTPVADSAYPEPPSIDIKDEQFVGALLILQELGEYELVLKLGRSYLSKESTDIDRGRFGEPKIARTDMVLTLALGCLELGREQWQQRRYEDAAETLGNGQEILLSEGVFANVRGELQTDLYKLRPYRVLELLALPEENTQERRKGLQLLEQMLQERGGIDGNGNDQSGLSTDNFLRFIQQLRIYLTSAEQQVLFEEEARRPSAVATYLAVYALLARGFTQHQPELIRRAKQMLMRLGKRQDVYLEQAICALLIGQTEEAAKALELSGEYESLAFIREHSQGAPDLLPGLCLYSERWLQSEVFPHFRDLAEREVSLKDYFADEKVETALESLPPETEISNEWEVVPSQTKSSSLGNLPSREAVARLKPQMERAQAIIESKLNAEPSLGGTDQSASATGTPSPAATATLSSFIDKTRTANLQSSKPQRVDSAVSRTDYMPQDSGTGSGLSGGGTGMGEATSGLAAARGRMSPGEATSTPGGSLQRLREKRRSGRSNRWLNQNLNKLSVAWRNLISPNGKSSAEQQKRLLLLAIAALLGLGILLFLLIKAIGSGRQQQTATNQLPAEEQPLVRLDQSLIETTEPAPNPLAAPGSLTEESAQQAIQTWLEAKAEAFGQNHALEPLNAILVDPALSRWQTQAQQAKDRNWYRKFEHSIEPGSIKVREQGPDQASVEARVSESAEHFQGDRLIRRESWNRPNLRVQYDLVRQEGQWQIRDMKVLR